MPTLSHRTSPSLPTAANQTRATTILRALLGVDAATCIVLGLVLVTTTAFAARLTGLPAALLTEVGVFLLAFGAVVASIATRRVLSRFATLCVVEANGAWVVASAVLAVDFMGDATSAGRVLVVGQAVAVAAIAIAEFAARRRLPA